MRSSERGECVGATWGPSRYFREPLAFDNVVCASARSTLTTGMCLHVHVACGHITYRRVAEPVWTPVR